MSKWKYNLKNNTVDEQPTMGKPDRYSSEQGHTLHVGFNEGIFNRYISKYNEHIKSLRHIPVSGEVDWKDGQEVVEGWQFIFTNGIVQPIIFPDNQPIKQEQPQKEYWQPSGNIPNSNWQPDTIEKQIAEKIAGYVHEIDSLRGTIRELVEKIKEGKEGKEGGVWVKADWILKMRDALVESDYNEVYHWLYQIASPNFDKNIDDVWTEIENITSKEAVVSKQLYEFVKASEDKPEHKIQVAFRINGFYYTAGEYNINSRSFFSIEGKDYDVKVVEWLKPIITEQGNDKQILLTKIQEQEIEIASLKNKVKELQSDYMAVQTEIQK